MSERQTPDGKGGRMQGRIHVHSSSQSRGEGQKPQSGSLTEQLTQAASQHQSHQGHQTHSASQHQVYQAQPPQGSRPASAASPARRPSLLVPAIAIIVMLFVMGGMGRGCGSIFGGSDGAGGFSSSDTSGGFFSVDNYNPYQAGSTYQIDDSLGAGNGNEKWTVLMYLCGSDLESASKRMGGGQATNSLVELTKTNLGQNVTYVIETGGARAWQNNVVSPRYLSRYTVEDGKLALRDQQPSASMAKESTFADFLQWGTTTYPADHYMVIIWDHGGGSITGVCQDDLYPYDSSGQADSLTLPEMRDAMQKAGVTFDVVGFDTCLMATVETAQILSPYAKYMVASEESEPGSGWDYVAWPNWLAAHPGTSGKDLGTVICQTYYNKCAAYRQSGMATLSVIDLSKVGKVSQAFEDASDNIALSTVDSLSLRRLKQGAGKAESFGESGFYSMNMVDLADFMSKTGDVIGNDAKAVISAIHDAVVYEVHGRNRGGASGLSVYYPLKISDRNDFKRYAEVTDNIPYLQFLAVMFGVYDNYQWNKFDNFVPLRGEPVEEKDVKIRYKQTQRNDGHLELRITKGADQVAKVDLEMYVYLEPLDILCYLGSDNDLNGSYDEGWFVDNFQDEWLTIDGHYVSATLSEEGNGYNLYYVPILLNDERTGLIVEYDYSTNEYAVLCAWDDANQVTNMAGKTGRLLQEGDKVQFLFPAANATTGASDVIPLETMNWHEDAPVVYEGLGDGKFAFRYVITDVLGNDTQTDLVYRTIKDGRVVNS